MAAQVASPWKTRAGRAAERSRKRDAVLRIAARSFCEKGVRATSLDAIAERLNVTKPTLYHYFAGKDEILAACVLTGLAMIDAALAEAGGAHALDRLGSALRRYAAVMTLDFGRCASRVAETELSPAAREAFRARRRAVDARIRGLIREGMREGSIRPGDVALTASTVAGALNGIAHWYDPAGPLPADEVARRVVEVLLGGLAPTG
ncbi:HTH-type transcriptional repressor KstR2 [Methylobacterium crusticola]|uniref:HTH-type transcriptional repressor KstR2 n=1 Tax=Methylobacterium crusticola TaxID=1697972 RepID=A0ABQ4R2J8_9HYPH|nr:TetR/AcrR family transcriptional regulator [Methylobacterium crusticola]GJD51369.1 HTH-type transcriptional repressor KstR2 [Methylobacterium crusticola]